MTKVWMVNWVRAMGEETERVIDSIWTTEDAAKQRKEEITRFAFITEFETNTIELET